MTSPTDAPRPALGELARTDTALIAEFRHCCEEWGATMNDRWFERARAAEDALTARVSALVALATGGAAIARAGQRYFDAIEAYKDGSADLAACDAETDAAEQWLHAVLREHAAARSLTPERPADA